MQSYENTAICLALRSVTRRYPMGLMVTPWAPLAGILYIIMMYAIIMRYLYQTLQMTHAVEVWMKMESICMAFLLLLPMDRVAVSPTGHLIVMERKAKQQFNYHVFHACIYWSMDVQRWSFLRSWFIAVSHCNGQAGLGWTRANHWILRLPAFYTEVFQEAGGPEPYWWQPVIALPHY